VKIVFHGVNAHSFLPGFDALVGPDHHLAAVADEPATPAEAEAIRTADVLVGVKLDASHPRPERIRLYHAPAAGIDAIDRSMLPAGTPLCCSPGHEHAIAEYVLAALLMRHVRLQEADRDLHAGKWTLWSQAPDTTRTELGGTTLGLLGFGHIGKAIAARAKAFGVRIVVANRSVVPLGPLVDAAYPLTRLRAFMSDADDVVVSLPLTSDTRGLVDATALAAMRRHGVIVNVGRGPVIDEQALYDVLAHKRIAGAVIDTWYRYPSRLGEVVFPATLPFHELDNVVMTPHMSAWTHGTVRRRQQVMAGNINRLMRGEPLTNVV
jgi:phosphoglycerate dehydrogenase-like enzyme